MRTMFPGRIGPLLMAALSVVSPLAMAQDAKTSGGTMKLLKTLPLGGDGRWDYLCVDTDARRVYVPRSTHVQVVDIDKGTVLGDIPGTNGVHGVALAMEQGLGFASNGRDNAVSVFDLKTYKVTKTIKTGKNPDAIIFDPASKHVLSINHSGGDITVIDPAALDKDPVTIAVGGTLEYAVADGAGHVFVNVEDKSEIVEIDTAANRVLAHWSIAPGDGPSGLAIDVAHHRLFSGCANQKLMVVDSESGKVIATVAVGKGIDGVAFDPTLGYAMTANGTDGTVSVVKDAGGDKYEAVQTPATVKGARTIAVDLKVHHALMPCTVPDGKGGQTFGLAVVGGE